MALKVGELFAEFKLDSSSFNSSINSLEQSCNKMGSSMMSAGVGLSAAITAPITKAAKDMYEAGTNFDAQMSKVFAIRGLDKQLASDVEAMEALRTKAIEMGSTTEWTATQAGEAFQYMAMAGWDTNEMLTGLAPIMNLATAAGADLGTTSDIVTDALTAFGLKAEDAAHFTDVLAAAATNSNTNVELLGTSFKYVAPLAGSLGMKTEDVAVALGLMANSGIKSTMAGAALRNILSGLNGTTDKAKEACEALGVSLRNEKGETKSLMEVMTDLRASYQGNEAEAAAMAEAVGKLDEQFAAGKITQEQYDAQLAELTAGSSDFMTACVELAGKQGLSGLLAIMRASPEDFEQLVAAMENCDGATDKMAATMRDNAKGAVTILKSAMEGLSITLWDLYKDKFTGVVNKATELIQSFQAMDSETQKTIMKFAGLAAAAGPVLIMGGKLVKMLPSVAKAIASLASPAGIAVAGLALFAVVAIDTDNTIGKLFTKSTKKAANKLKEFNKKITSNMSAISGRVGELCKSIVEGLDEIVPAAMETIGLVIEGFMNSIADNAAEISKIGVSLITGILSGITKSLPKIIPAAAKMVTNLATAVIDNMPTFVSAVGDLLSAFKDGIEAIDWLGLGQQILTSLENAISSITDIFDGWFNDSLSHVEGQDWASIGTKMIDMILDTGINIATQIGDFITNIVDKLGSYTGWEGLGAKLGAVAQHLIEGIANAIPKLANIVVKIIEKISEVLSGEGVESLKKGFESLAGSIVTGLTNAIPKVGEGASMIVKAITKLLNDLTLDDATDVFKGLGEKIVNLIATGIKAASDVAVTIVQAISSMFADNGIINDLATAAGDIAVSLIGAIVKAIPDVEKAAVDIITEIGKLFEGKGAASDFLSAGTNVATSIIDAIVQALPQLKESAKNIVTTLGNVLKGIDWTGAIDNLKTLGEALMKAIVEAIKNAGDLAKSIVETIGNVLKDIPWDEVGKSLESIGKMLIDGIVKGIEAVGDAEVQILDKVGEIFKGIDWEKVESFVSSIGNTLIDGIIKGIDKITDADIKILDKIGEILQDIDWEKAATAIGNIGETLIKGIVDGIGKVLDGGKRIFDKIAEIIKGIKWDDVANAVSDVAQKLFNGIVEGAKKLTPDMTELIGAIGRGIEAALGSLGTIAGTLIGNLVKFVLDPANWMKLIELGGKIVEGIATGIIRLGESILTGAWDFISNTITSFLKALGIDLGDTAADAEVFEHEMAACEDSLDGFYRKIMQMEGNPWSGIFDADSLQDYINAYNAILASGNQEIINSVSQFNALTDSAVVSMFQTLLDTTASESERVAALIALQDLGLDSWLADSFAETNPVIMESAAAMSEDAVTAFTNAFTTLGYVIPDAVKAGLEAGTITVEEAAAQVVAAASTANDQATAEASAKATGEGVTSELSGAEKAGEGDVESASEGLTEAATIALETLPDVAEIVGDDATSGMATAIDNGKSSVVTAMEGLSNEVVQAALKEMTYTTGYTTGYDYTDAIKKGIEAVKASLVTTAGTVAKAVVDRVKTWLNNSIGYNQGAIFTTGVKSGISSNSSAVYQASQTMASNAKDAAANILTSGAGSTIGSNFASGLAAGIRAGKSSVISAAIEVAKAAAKAAKDELGIKSPSRVARDEIGAMYDLGIVKGLQDEAGAVENAASKISDTLNGAFMIGESSRGTVLTSQQQATKNASENAKANGTNTLTDKAETIGKAIANRLIESGVLDSDIYMNGDLVGKKTYKSVSKEISSNSRKTINGRKLQGVIA